MKYACTPTPLPVWISPLGADSLACNINKLSSPPASSYADIPEALFMAPLSPLTEVVLFKHTTDIWA